MRGRAKSPSTHFVASLSKSDAEKKAYRQPTTHIPSRRRHDDPKHVGRFRAEGHANAKFVGAGRHALGLGYDTVKPDGREGQRKD